MKRKITIIFCISFICAIAFTSITIYLSRNNKEESEYSNDTNIYNEVKKDEVKLPRAIMVNDQIYIEDGPVNIKRCGICDGMISTTIENGSMPTKNDESNFGIGYRYQNGGEIVDVFIDNEWIRFNKKQ